MRGEFDTWTDMNSDVACTRYDHFPVCLERIWQPVVIQDIRPWHAPIMHRPAIKEGPHAEAFRHNLSLVESPPLGTPVNHLHAYVVRTLQIQGAMCFPIPERAPKRESISEEAWRSMTLLHDWRKTRVRERSWWQKVLLAILFQGWCSFMMTDIRRNALSLEIHP